MANLLQKFGNYIDNVLNKRSQVPYAPTTIKITEAFPNGIQFFQNGPNEVIYFESGTDKDIKTALTECPPIRYIINKKARAFCSGNIVAQYITTGNPVKGMDKIFQDIIDKPNFIQTGYQFKMQNYAQMQAFGLSVCLKIMAGGQLSSIWALPNDKVEIEWLENWTPFKRKNILSAIKSIKYCGEDLNKDDIYVFTDSTPCETGMILPVSRLVALKHQINNLIINYTSRGRLMNKPMGILSNDIKDNISGMDLDPDEITKLHNDFDKYGLSASQRRFIITNANLDWKPISFPLSDMQMDIFERNDTITIAEGLDYPPFLLGISEKGIYNNVSEAYKALYTGSIIPDGENYVQQLVQCFNSSTKNVTYIIDFSHLAVLQEGLKYKNEARQILVDTLVVEFNANAITYGAFMEALGNQLVRPEWKDMYAFELPFSVKAQPKTTNQKTPTTDATAK